MVGTSATLGSRDDAPRIAEYAADLFGERVEHHSHDELRQDIVMPTLEPPPAPAKTWQAPVGAFRSFRAALDSGSVTDAVTYLVSDAASADVSAGTRSLLDALSAEQHVVRLARLLHDSPINIADLPAQVFADPRPLR